MGTIQRNAAFGGLSQTAALFNSLDAILRQAILQRDGGRCVFCYEVVVPMGVMRRSGMPDRDTFRTLVTACEDCSMAKGTKVVAP